MDYIEITAVIKPLVLGREVLVAQFSEIGFESFVETEKGLKAYIQKEEYKEGAMNTVAILKNKEFTIEIETKFIADQNWNKTWEENFEPIDVLGKCFIRAPFHLKKDAVEYDIVIDPKMSFGTGHHSTTYLMIKKMLDIDLSGKRVLDMGCGTAVLAILAKLKNAGYTEAIDIDEWAYNNSIENIRNNNCDDIVVKKGGAELLGNKEFDLVLANINRNILLADMVSYSKSMALKGNILLSGFFSSDVDLIIDEAKKNGLSLVDSEHKNDWTLLHLIKI